MSSSQSNAQEMWKQCINATMFLRGHCHNRPCLYFTESGYVVLHFIVMDPADTEVRNAITVTCDLIAEECGFRKDTSASSSGLYAWRKGGAA